MRDLLIEAAFELFGEQGFDGTTIDDIVGRAGVGRRSFFRYFPAKEDVVFPDHERCLEELKAFLRAPGQDGDPVERACEATLLVARMYAERPDRSLLRYRLTRDVPALRDHELTVIRRYERALADYLRDAFTFRPDGALQADIVAAAATAAHNHALRSWLRSGASGDAVASANAALTLVREGWGAPLPDPEDYVVLVTRSRAPIGRVVQQVEHALARLDSADRPPTRT